MNSIKLSLIIFLVTLLFPRVSVSGEGSFLKYSVNANTSNISAQKGLSFGYQDEVLFLDKKWEAGFWFDNSNKPGAKNSAFMSYSVGIEPMYESFYAHFFQGIGVISCPDSQLGGPVQFFEDIGFGIRDKRRGVALGLQYKHISSAGIFLPNHGRDTLGLQLMIPW